MRPGTIFTSSRDDGLRYIDKDGAEAWTSPNSRYYAGQTILRGQAVSIAKAEDLASEKAHDKYPYIKVTDPDLDETCIGVAMNYAEAGDIVHVQSKGKFTYYTTGNVPSGRQSKEVILDPDYWNYAKVQGQRIFVKKVNENPDNFETGHNTEDPSQSVDNKNNFTYDLNDSIYNVKHTIQLGYLTDAPTSRDAEDSTVTIELDVTGDTRGPIDNTQFLVKLGEDFSVSYDLTKNIASNPLYTQDIPHFNLSIKEELKVLAMSISDPYPASFGISMANPVVASQLPPNQFIAIRKLDGQTIFLSMFTQLDLDAVTDASDRGYISLSKGMVSSPSELINNTVISTGNIATIANAIKTAMDTLIGGTSTIEVVGADGRIITAGVNKGYYDIYVSQGLLRYVTVYSRKHGHSAAKGTAILADIRDKERCDILGIALVGAGTYHAGETIRVMKMGRITTKSEMLVGKQYYLGLNGKLTAQEQYWYDYCVPIGIAESPHYFIVDTTAPLKNYDGAMPLGTIKPSIYGTAEKGFVVMDGYTVYNKDEYPELYEALKQWYSEDELKPSHRSPTATDFHNAQANFLSFINTEGGLQEFFASVESFQHDVQELRGDFQRATEESTAIFENLTDANTQALAHISQLQDLLGESLLTTQEFNDWLEADTGFNQLQEAFDSLQGDYDTTKNSLNATVQEYNRRLNSLENVIDPTNSSTTGLTARVTALEEDLDTLTNETLPQGLNALAATVEANLASLNTSMSNELSNLNTSLSETITSLETGFNESLSTLEGRADTLEEGVTALEGRADTLESGVTALEERASSLEGRTDTLEPKVSNLEGRADALEGRADALEVKTTELEEELIATNDEVDSLNDDLNNLAEKVEVVEEDVDILEGRVDTLEENLAATDTTLGNLSSTVDDLTNTTLPGMEETIENMQNDYLTKAEAESTYVTKAELSEMREQIQEKFEGLDDYDAYLKGLIDQLAERLNGQDSGESSLNGALISALNARMTVMENNIRELRDLIENHN